MTSIPIGFRDRLGGLVGASGLIRGDGPDLVVEFQETFAGVIRGKPKVVRVPLTQVESVKLRRGWFGRTAMTVQAKSLAAVAALPGSECGRVEFLVARADPP